MSHFWLNSAHVDDAKKAPGTWRCRLVENPKDRAESSGLGAVDDPQRWSPKTNICSFKHEQLSY